MRKLASIRKISEISAIENADAIAVASIDGWKVVVKKDEFKINDLVVYFEIDSWVPTTIAPFLSKGNEPREYYGVKGEKLRTIKLRGQISQGLILPVSILDTIITSFDDGDDLTEILNVQKYEPPVSAQLAGLAKGNFPSFIPKTDEERVQNLKKSLSTWSTTNIEVEITEKLDGSSMTVFWNNGEFGVCSRNVQLKDTAGNSFWEEAHAHDLEQKLTTYGKNIAIQGELFGAGMDKHTFYVFRIYDIDTGEYLSPSARHELVSLFNLEHVPVLGYTTLTNHTIESLLTLSEDKSIVNSKVEREGIVLKGVVDTNIHFKCISNKFLLKVSGT